MLLTGATGHIGSRLLDALRRDHPDLSIRATAPDAPPAGDGIDWVRADFTDPACNYDALVEGMEQVWHLGAATRAEDPDMWPVNVEATRSLAQAAAQARVRRFLFTSTAFAYGYRSEAIVGDGEALATEPWFPSKEKFAHYGRSKFAAEKAIEHVERGAMQTMVLRLCIVSSQERGRASLASYSPVQRRLWAGRYWHVIDADETASDLSRLPGSDAWPADGSIAYYNYTADAARRRIGDVTHTLAPSGASRALTLLATALPDRVRSWQRNGLHIGRRGLPDLLFDGSGLAHHGICPRPFDPRGD